MALQGPLQCKTQVPGTDCQACPAIAPSRREGKMAVTVTIFNHGDMIQNSTKWNLWNAKSSKALQIFLFSLIASATHPSPSLPCQGNRGKKKPNRSLFLKTDAPHSSFSTVQTSPSSFMLPWLSCFSMAPEETRLCPQCFFTLRYRVLLGTGILQEW